MNRSLKANFRGESDNGSQFKLKPDQIDPDTWYQINISPVELLQDDILDFEEHLLSIVKVISRMQELLIGTYKAFEIKLYTDISMAKGKVHFHGIIKIKNLLYLQYWLLHKLHCNYYIDTIDDMDKREQYMKKFIIHLEQNGINGYIDNEIKIKQGIRKKTQTKRVPNDKIIF